MIQQTLEETLVAEVWREGLRPPENMYPWQWADRNRVLTSKVSGEPGPFRTSRTPYIRGIMEELSPKRIHPQTGKWILNRTRCVVLEKGSQLGGTDALLNWIGHGIEQNPGPDYVVFPTIENGRRWSKIKFDTMWQTTKSLRARIHDARERGAGNEILMKEYDGGGLLGIGGSNSPAGLRQLSLRRIACDDFDGFAPDAGGEGSPDELIANRQSTFIDAMTFLISTPTHADTSNIHRAFLKTDQRYYFVHCLKCGHPDYFRWKNIVWPKGKPLEAKWKCEKCLHLHSNSDKKQLLAGGIWKPTATPIVADWVGFHLSGFYAPPGWESWGQIAVKFLQAKGIPELMQVWVNTKLGEPWSDGTYKEVSADGLITRRESYSSETLPEGINVLVAAIDVQSDRLEVQVDGYGDGLEYWNVDHFKIYGDPSVVNLSAEQSNQNVWRRALDIINRTYTTAEKKRKLRPLATCCDTGGDNTMKAYQFCREAARLTNNLWAIKGKEGKIPLWPKKVSNRNKGRVNLYSVGVDTAKATIYSNVAIPDPGPAYRHYPTARDPEYFDQLFSERRLTTYSRGFPVHRWHLLAGRKNEALDLSVYTLAAVEGLIRSGAKLSKVRVVPGHVSSAEPFPDEGASTDQRQASPVVRRRVMHSSGVDF